MPAGQDMPLLADQGIADEEEAAKKENKDAYVYLAAYQLSAQDLRYVRKARPAAWPQGLASRHWRYVPDMTAMANSISKLMALKMVPKRRTHLTFLPQWRTSRTNTSLQPITLLRPL
jgi:hypothetical protein